MSFKGSKRVGGKRQTKLTDLTASDDSGYQAVCARTRKEPVKSACCQCQKRKTKCSGQCPVCRFCSDRKLECSWDVPDGLTKTADLKRKIQETTSRVESLELLVNAMRSGTDDVSTMLLASLRLGASVEGLVGFLQANLASMDDRESRTSAVYSQVFPMPEGQYCE